MEICNLSTKYTVRKLVQSDINIILDLSMKNDIFYRYHQPFVTKESIIYDMEALPPQKEYTDKFYIGFFEGVKLIAIMDIILDYPKEGTVFIGLFMTNIKYQGKGIGTMIIEECLSYMNYIGFKNCRLCIDKGNPQSEAFWIKNKFIKTGEEYPNDFSTYIPMERAL